MPSSAPDISELDVLVIGGGPAGSATGTFLARAGLKVLILEKETFPRFVIGESLLPHGNDILRELGVWEDIEAAGFTQKRGAEFCTGDGTRFQRFWFGQVLGKTYEQTFQVDRATFDDLLLKKALKAGCTVKQGVKIVAISPGKDRDSHTIRFEQNGATFSVSAPWLVDATGRSGLVGNTLKIPKFETQTNKRTAIYGHFKGVTRNTGKAAGHITIVRFKDGWFWLIPLANDITSVGLVISNQIFRHTSSSDLNSLFQTAVTANPEVALRLSNATNLLPLRATADYSSRFQTFAQSRVLLTGDAAGFVDPIFSSGVMLALKSGKLAAQHILRATVENRGLTPEEQRTYTRKILDWMNLYHLLIGAFYDNAGFEVFMNPNPFLKIPASIARLVGGQTELSFPIIWRLHLFKLLCSIQRTLRFAPQISALQ